MTRFHYRHHGLKLGASQPLPRLTPCEASSPDITIEVLEPGQVPELEVAWVMADPSLLTWRAETDAGTLLRLRYANADEWAEYIVGEDGSNVWVSRSENVPLPEAAELLLGPVFSCVLAHRGMTCVHAAVLRVEDKVVALAGPSGAGKSTTTTAFLRRGATLISDDVAVLIEIEEIIAVLPGHPRLRLRPDAARVLGSETAMQPMWVHEGRRPAKRYLPVDASSWIDDDRPLALDVLYFLSARSDEVATPELIPLSPQQALAQAMALRHMAVVLGREDHQRDFETLARLAEAIPARELLRPEGLQSLPDTLDLITSDVRALG